jgi:flagellar biosynthetic protein FliR
LAPFQLNESEIIIFGLALIRISAFFVSWPVFSQFSVPSPIKVLISLAVTFCIFGVIPRDGIQGANFETSLTWWVAKEALIGLAMGFTCRLMFYAVEIGGHIIATSMGLTSATVFNPASGTNSTVIEKFYIVLLTLLLLGLNVHHSFLSAMVESFYAVPMSLSGIDLAAVIDQKGGSEMFQQVTVAGLKMSAPVMVVIFFLNVAMGIVGRAVPQINVLVTSLPVNILAGLLVMIVTLPALVLELDKGMVGFVDLVFRLLKTK